MYLQQRIQKLGGEGAGSAGGGIALGTTTEV